MNYLFLCMFVLIFASYTKTINLETIKNRKKQTIESIYRDPQRISNRFYDVKRVITTINCPDCDEIPKIEGAGTIFSSSQGDYQLMHNGVKIRKDCYYGELACWMTDIIYGLHGHHEPQEEKAFYEILKYIPSRGTMVELGSYWGYYSLWFAFAIIDARNYMIDVADPLLSIGKDNFKLNNKIGHFELGHVGNYPEYRSSPQIFIDSFLEDRGITHVNILHSDIQGAELDMLRSCEKSIARNMIDYFVISTHYEGEINDILHNACLTFLKERDFHIVVEHTPAQSCSADGLIIAKRKGVVGPEYIHISKYNH